MLDVMLGPLKGLDLRYFLELPYLCKSKQVWL